MEKSKEFRFIESKLGTLQSYDTIYLRAHEIEQLLTEWHQEELNEYRGDIDINGLIIDQNE